MEKGRDKEDEESPEVRERKKTFRGRGWRYNGRREGREEECKCWKRNGNERGKILRGGKEGREGKELER